MGLQAIRKSRHLTQHALAEMSGINYRSLQDYEQGHKKLSAASGDVLLRLATVLGCGIPDLLLDDVAGAPLMPANTVDISDIESRVIRCEKYNVSGRWVCRGGKIAVLFYYLGRQYIIPFRAVFRPELMPCLEDAAALMIEIRLDDEHFKELGFEEWK